jgi:hypothetical protein
MKKWKILFVLLGIVIVGCVAQTPTADVQLPQPSETALPASNSYPAPNAYPEPVDNGDQQAGTGARLPTATADFEISPVIISEVSREGETEQVVLLNVSNQSQEISRIALYNPNTGDRKYLPQGKILEPNESYSIYNGLLPAGINEEQKWTDYPMLQYRDDEVLLLNEAGRMIWTYVYYP